MDTRIMVYDVLGWLSADMSYDEIIADFPELTEDDILACLAFVVRWEHTLRSLEQMKLFFAKIFRFVFCVYCRHSFLIDNPEQQCLKIYWNKSKRTDFSLLH
jgi:hypothetical protein